MDIHLLLFDQVKQEVQRTLVHGDGDFVRRGHGGLVYKERSCEDRVEMVEKQEKGGGLAVPEVLDSDSKDIDKYVSSDRGPQ